ncbi:MAG: SpoIVB peptidase S55 domain-containing protein [Halanaerobiales bacterium]
MKSKKIYLIYVLGIMIMFSTFANAVEIMELNEIRAGMEGYAKTVFNGYEIMEFPVEIINILEDQGLNTDLILFKASGDKIDEVGGIAAGMSGSPVFIDGKLIGAIGYGWSFSDHRYGLITPIEDMLKLLDEPLKQDEEKDNLIRFNTPLYISGMNGRSFSRMENKFENLGFEVLQGGGYSSVEEVPDSFEPGSAIAVQLVRGDINVASIGTLTYKENEKILAFGHPFFNKGDVDYLLSRANINGIIPSIESPFKLGSATDELIGSIHVDRRAGVAGQLNQYPKIIPLTVKVNDIDRDKTNVVSVQMVKDEDLLTDLMTNVSLQSLDSTLDRIGSGTAHVNFKITGQGLPDMTVERSNVFYSRSDIAAVSLYEIYNIMDIITSNPFEEVNLIDIKLDIVVEDTDNVALIQEAKVLNEEIRPGDRLEVEITLRPYRSEPFVKTVFIDLPEDMNSGLATMVIDGGLTGESYQAIPEEGTEEEDNQAIIEGYKDLDSILEDYLNSAKNNELIVQVYPGYPMAGIDQPAVNPGEATQEVQDETGNQGDPSAEDYGMEEDMSLENQDIREAYPTDYVLEGSLSIDLNVLEKDNSETIDEENDSQKE